MKTRGILIVWLTVVIFLRSAAVPAAEKLPFPVPQAERVQAYIQEAFAFVNRNPESEYAPRVLMDMLMVFAVTKNEKDRNKMRRMLIARFPESLEGRFAASLFEDESEYRKELLKMFDEDADGSKIGFGRGFLPRALIGVKTFNFDIFKHPEFLIRSIFAAEEIGEVRLKDQLMQLLRSNTVGSDNDKELMKIAFDHTRDHMEKIRAVRQRKDSGAKKFLTQYLMSRLSKKELGSVAMQKILIESKLKYSKWEEAVALIDRVSSQTLSDDGQAQLKFWKGWALASFGHLDNAEKTLALLVGKHPQSPWRKSAQIMISAVAAQSASRDDNIDALHGLLKTLNDELEAVEVHLNWNSKDLELSVYVSYRNSKDEVQLIIQNAGLVRLAYSFGPNRSRLYAGTDGITLIGEGIMPVFAPQFKVIEAEDGQLNFSMNASNTGSYQAGKSSLQGILKQPLFSTRGGAAKLINKLLRDGWMPLPAKEDGRKQRLHEWIVPQTDRAEFTTVRVETDERGRLRSVSSGDEFQLHCEYGSADQITLEPPTWPKSRQIKVDKQNFGVALISKFVPAIMELAK